MQTVVLQIPDFKSRLFAYPLHVFYTHDRLYKKGIFDVCVVDPQSCFLKKRLIFFLQPLNKIKENDVLMNVGWTIIEKFFKAEYEHISKDYVVFNIFYVEYKQNFLYSTTSLSAEVLRRCTVPAKPILNDKVIEKSPLSSLL